MGKSIFINNSGGIHFGVNAPEGFDAADNEAVKAALTNLAGRKLWRCTVCNDVHLGEPPKKCPTCQAIDAYVEINESEFRKIIGL